MKGPEIAKQKQILKTGKTLFHHSIKKRTDFCLLNFKAE